MKIFKTVVFAASALFFLVLTVKPPTVHALIFGQTTGSYQYPTGSLINDKGTIYFINGINKIPFTNWAAFQGLGYSLKNVISGDLSNYTSSQKYIINSANTIHPWGQWLSYKGTVYYSTDQGLIAVPSGDIFINNGGKWNLLVSANQYDLAELQASSNLPLLANYDSRIMETPGFAFGDNTNTTPPPADSQNPSGTTVVVPNSSSTPDNANSNGNLNLPTLSASSPVAKFVLSGASNQPMAVFNFTASGGPVTIVELDFMVQSNLNGGVIPPISSIGALSGSSQVLPGATSSIAFLNLTVPNNSTGVNVPVTVNCATINPPNSPSDQIFTLNLTGVKYTSAGQTSFLSLNLPSNPIGLISSIPSVSISGPSGPLYDGQTLLGQVTVSAAGGGGITIDQLPITITSTGNAISSSTPNDLIVTENGFPINTSNNPVSFGVGTTTTNTMLIFSNDNLINPNSSKTYTISLTLSGAVGNNTNIALSLGDPSGFIFNDTAAGATNILGSSNGVSLANYPTNSVITHN